MAPQLHYAKAPITEAIIDFRIEPSPDDGVARLRRFADEIAADYPRSDRLRKATTKIKLGAEMGASVDAEEIGFVLVGEDERNIAQARLNGFSFSRLAPYERWEPFRDEARRLWDLYQSIVAPTDVVRMALRYINRLNFPLPVADFRDYLRVFPEVSPDLPQGLDGFFLRLSIPQNDIGSMLLLNETVVPPVTPDVVSVVLDIDVFRTNEIPKNDSERWAFFEVLHTRKNEVFEASITDTTRELID